MYEAQLIALYQSILISFNVIIILYHIIISQYINGSNVDRISFTKILESDKIDIIPQQVKNTVI